MKFKFELNNSFGDRLQIKFSIIKFLKKNELNIK